MLKPGLVFFTAVVTVAVLAAILAFSYLTAIGFIVLLGVEAAVLILLLLAFQRRRSQNIMSKK